MAIPKNTPGSPELSVVSTDVEAPSSSPAPILSLEICRGKTNYPRRPVSSPNFVIGSGAGCDLRLGGEEIPEAHAVLLQTRKDVRVQWLGEGPQLLLNGEPVHEAVLKDGDRIGIGRFEFLVHHMLAQQTDLNETQSGARPREADLPRETPELMSLLAEAKTAQPRENDLSEMSAGELLDRLEAAQELVDDCEAGLRRGKGALMFAVTQRAWDLSEEHSANHQNHTTGQESEAAKAADSDPVEAEILEELERVIHQLSGVSSELDERAARLANQEATQAEAAELLLEAQKQLAAQLQRFHQQIAEHQETQQSRQPPAPRLRKAA